MTNLETSAAGSPRAGAPVALEAHQHPVARMPDKPPHLGGPTLADRMRAIEAAFDSGNTTDGLAARAGRKDIMDQDGNITGVTVFVEMIPAPEEFDQKFEGIRQVTVNDKVEEEKVSGVYKAHRFDVAKVRAHDVGDRSTATAATLEEAVTALEKKLGVGGVK